jgi:steroid delta-isomerase-like uncharacterized protein
MRTAILFVACSALLAVSSAQTASPTTASSQATTSRAQSRSPKAVLQALVSAFNRHDFAALDTLVAPQGVYEDFAARFRGVGPAEVKDFLRGVIQEEPDFNWQLTTIIEFGAIVIAEWTWTSTYTGEGPDGKRLVAQATSGRGATIAIIENGQIKQLHDYYDAASFFPKVPNSRP